MTASEGRQQIQEGAHQERFRALEGLTENPKGPGAPGDASFVGALVEVEAVTGGESRPCPPRKTGDPVEQSLAVTSATSSSLGPSAQLQSLVEVEAVTGGESRPCPPRKTAPAVGESLVVSGVIAPLAPTNQLQSLVEVEAVTGGESRPCPPRKTAVAVGESLVVPDGIAPLAPASQLQFLAAAPAVTGGESRPGDPRALVEVEAVAGGEPRPCPPRRTGYPVGASLEVTAGAPLAPKDLDLLMRQRSLHPEINLLAATPPVVNGVTSPLAPIGIPIQREVQPPVSSASPELHYGIYGQRNGCVGPSVSPLIGGLNPTRSAPHVDLLSGGPWGGNGGGREADQTGLPSWLRSLATTQETNYKNSGVDQAP